MSKARTLANLISDNAELADGQISVAEVVGAAPTASPTFTGNIDAGDNVKIRLGDSDDLQIYSNNNNSFITESGSGSLFVNASNLVLRNTSGEYYFYGNSDGAVNLYHDNEPKLATTATGIDVTGNATFADNGKAIFGAGSDLEIYHSGSASHIKETGTGNLKLEGTNIELNNGAGTKTYILATDGGAVSLRHNDVTKLATTSTGIDVTGTATSDALDLTAIAKDISDTAVDVFVYDTSKDSDGGAWRKRTQNTSWYNETLNTSTRGSRKEFPAVAVLVLEQRQLTIYDGDDPAMPMWMQFDVGGSNSSMTMLNRGDNDLASVEALNGVMGVGALNQNNHSGGVRKINFIADYCYIHDDNTTYTGFHRGGGIANRNLQLGNVPNAEGRIVARSVNDIAMTVLPNAPIDADTGLPVPTIAVATDGGVSVIKDDGTVLSTASSSYAVGSIQILPTGEIYHSQGQSGNNGFCYNDNFERLSGLQIGTFANNSTFWYVADNVGNDSSLLGGGLADENAVNENLDTAVGTSSGLTAIALNPSSLNDGMVAWRTSDYNTGWMNGDIKLATLSDTDDTNVTGSELVTNGTFASNTTGWTAGVYSSGSVASLSIVSGKLRITSSGATYGAANQTITTVVGKTYVATVDFTKGTASGYLWIGTTLNGYNNAHSGLMTSTQTKIMTFVATGTTTYVNLILANTNNGTSDFDNVSVRLAEEDRSVNGNGLQVFGTVTKTAVATGADLMAYSGWTAGNYLQQPYNSDLDFGTGDFSFITWFKCTAAGGAQYWYKRGENTGGSAGMTIWTAADLQYIALYINGTGIQTPTGIYPLGAWNQLIIARRSGVATFYVNGRVVLVHAITDSVPTGMATQVGYNATTSSLSLTRISATIPSPEQIAKIYEDEKVLFQDGAQATLYGSSDAVTALAHDDTTDLLHVGTSAGRSVFQGLRRVDNTTDAVGAAISASNGLVAED